MIYTFYSYKGGVGRSMALVNTAELFYRAGLKVLMIDWDLEAPGLERWFFHDQKMLEQVLDRRGLIDMFLGYKKQMAQEEAISVGEQGELPFENPRYLAVNIYPEATGNGQLLLLSAGRRSKEAFADYARSVLTFDWQDFYQNWGGERYIEWLRQQFESMADIVMVDSRTGVTELGGICTYQLADTVIMFCSPSQQSLDGTYKMALNFTDRQLQNLRPERPLNIIILPARVENTESNALDAFQTEFQRLFKDFLPLSPNSDFQQLWELSIPYIPKYAYQELIAVRESDKASAENMVTAFRRLRRMIRRQRVERLVHIDPERVAREFALALLELQLNVRERENREDLFQIEALVETFAGQLAVFEPLLSYTRGMAELVRGNIKDATDHISKVSGMRHDVYVVDIRLPIPAQIIEASQRVEQVLRVYQRDYEQLRQTVCALLKQDEPDSSPVRQLLALLQAAVEAEDYREILRLSEDPSLKQLESDVQTREIQQVIAKIVWTVQRRLNAAVQFARELGQQAKAQTILDEEVLQSYPDYFPEQAKAQTILDEEVLQHYPDYPPARELQREWARHNIQQGLEQDSQDYAELEHQIRRLQYSFWSANEVVQHRAIEMTYNLDQDALMTSPGLERAAAAVKRLSKLNPSDDLTLQQVQLEVRAQQTRRQLLRLRSMLYQEDLARFEVELRDVQESELLLQDVRNLRDEYAAVAKMNEALVAFENGDWQKTWAAVLVARSNYPDAPRIDALIERTKNAPQIEISLGNQLLQTLHDLMQLEQTSDITGNKLVKINTQIQEIKAQIDRYIYFARNYTGQYTELLEQYQTAWQQAANHAFEHRRLNVADDARAIEELERLVSIAPWVHKMGALIQRLQGRVHVLRARQKISAACLNQVEESVRVAMNMLPPDDQLLQEVRDTLRQKLAFVHFSRHQATTYEQQHELSKAHHSVLEALAKNQEDQEAEAIRVRLEAEIEAVQELARQATALEQEDLPQSLALWQEVCKRHTDGVYPSASARLFIELQNDVNQRIETSRQHIADARTEFQILRNWLAPQRRPVWPDFNHYCQQVLAHLSAVEPGMWQEQLSWIEAAIHLLERYRDAYQHLETLLSSEDESSTLAQHSEREQARDSFQAVWADIRSFSDASDSLLENLVISIQPSYDRMTRLLRFTWGHS